MSNQCIVKIVALYFKIKVQQQWRTLHLGESKIFSKSSKGHASDKKSHPVKGSKVFDSIRRVGVCLKNPFTWSFCTVVVVKLAELMACWIRRFRVPSFQVN